jgi:hypothetical protein
MKYKNNIFFMDTGNDLPAKNQRVIYTPQGLYLQSFQDLVAYRSHDGSVELLGLKWNYSVTTKQYVRRFFEQKDRGLDLGTMSVVDLITHHHHWKEVQ